MLLTVTVRCATSLVLEQPGEARAPRQMFPVGGGRDRGECSDSSAFPDHLLPTCQSTPGQLGDPARRRATMWIIFTPSTCQLCQALGNK